MTPLEPASSSTAVHEGHFVPRPVRVDGEEKWTVKRKTALGTTRDVGAPVFATFSGAKLYAADMNEREYGQ